MNNRKMKSTFLTVSVMALFASACGSSTTVETGGQVGSQESRVGEEPTATSSKQPVESLPVNGSDCDMDVPYSIEEFVEEAGSIVVARLVDVQPGFRYRNSERQEGFDIEDVTRWEETILLEFKVVEAIKGQPGDDIRVPIVGYETSNDKVGATRTAIFESCGLRINEANKNEMFGIALNDKQADGTYTFQDILHLTEDGAIKDQTSLFHNLFKDEVGKNFSELVGTERETETSRPNTAENTNVESFVGLDAEEATNRAEEAGYETRIVFQDGTLLDRDSDLRQDRINFSVKNKIVTKAKVY